MAGELDHGEFWLPPEFLTDDDILMDFKKPISQAKNREIDSVLSFPCDFGGTGFSELSSPASEESEEEDYLAGLTRKMANSSLLEELWRTETQKSFGISVSPQSTLCGCTQGSGRVSPNNCPSPPSADRNDAGAWDLLYAAAGEVARMRMMEEANAAYYQNRGLKPISRQIETNPNLGFRSHQTQSQILYQQLQIAKFQQLKRQQMMRQAAETAQTMASSNSPWPFHARHVAHPRDRNTGLSSNPNPNPAQSAWPTLQQSLKPQQQVPPQQQQQSNGSGMRAVFLGSSGSDHRKIGGTGVFLPRRVGTTTAPEPRKRTGCSTVLLPDRVVQALNLNLEAMEPAQPQHQSRFNVALTSDFDAAVNYRNNVLLNQQKMNLRPSSVATHTDLRLPQEWTY